MKRILTVLSLTLTMTIGIGQTAYNYIDINQVDALISASGNHFWDFSDNHFYVPADSMTQAIFTSTLWVGGLDSANELHVAAERFRQVGQDYFPGPYGDNSSYNPPNNGSWNNVWKVNKTDLDTWLSSLSAMAPTSATDWPAHGDMSLGQDYYLAPFVDVDGDGQYNTNNWDYPAMKGDQTLFFMYNDHSSVHTESGGAAMGLEIRGMAYAFDCPQDQVLDQTLFMEHTIYNKSNEDYHDVYIANWNDYDLGNYSDDYIGCDPVRNLYFAYNGDTLDEDANGNQGYGNNLPAIGVRLLETPLIEADGIDNPFSLTDSLSLNGIGFGDGIVDNEQLGLAYHSYNQNAAGPTGDPSIATDYYNYMRGLWKDGSSMTYGGNGWNPGDSNAVPCRYMFPDSSDIYNIGTNGTVMPLGWSETTAGNTPGDRRGLGSVGPFDLPAGSHVKFTYAYVFGQAKNDNLLAVDVMKANSDHIDSLFRSGTTPCGDFEVYFTVGIDETNPLGLDMYPNPASEQVRITGLTAKSHIKILDVQGRIIQEQAVSAATSNQIDVSDLPAGRYSVNITSEGKTSVLPLIVTP